MGINTRAICPYLKVKKKKKKNTEFSQVNRIKVFTKVQFKNIPYTNMIHIKAINPLWKKKKMKLLHVPTGVIAIYLLLV
jgi:hypothetical protein